VDENCERSKCICVIGIAKDRRKAVIVEVKDCCDNSARILFLDPEELKEDRRNIIKDIIKREAREKYLNAFQYSVECCETWKRTLRRRGVCDLKRVDCVFVLDSNIVFVENEALTKVDLERIISVFLSKFLPKFLTTLYIVDIICRTFSENSNVRVFFIVIYYVNDLLKEEIFGLHEKIERICKESQLCSIHVENVDREQMVITCRLVMRLLNLSINVLFKLLEDTDLERVSVTLDKLRCSL